MVLCTRSGEGRDAIAPGTFGVATSRMGTALCDFGM